MLLHSALRPDTEGKLIADQPKGSAKIAIELVVDNECHDGPTCYPEDVQLGANDVATTVMPYSLMSESSRDIASRPMSTGATSTIVVKRVIAGRALSLLDDCESQLDVRGECLVSPLTRTMTHSARLAPNRNTRDASSIMNDPSTSVVKNKIKAPQNRNAEEHIHDQRQDACVQLMQWLIETAKQVAVLGSYECHHGHN